ncbi:MAG TPA: hypothetical protein PLX17_03765 [Chitinophagaceae bacterium]|nr:hypothetical protein [Chitinophagaceae bacterium]HQW95204.1 hypothetical protein [Saprospiraceae bacterium]
MSTDVKTNNNKWYIVAIGAAIVALTFVYKSCNTEDPKSDIPVVTNPTPVPLPADTMSQQ